MPVTAYAFGLGDFSLGLWVFLSLFIFIFIFIFISLSFDLFIFQPFTFRRFQLANDSALLPCPLHPDCTSATDLARLSPSHCAESHSNRHKLTLLD